MGEWQAGFSRFGVKPDMRWYVVLVTSLLASGCSNGLNTSCEWPDESTRMPGIAVASDALIRDVELAEELSIRFGDERWPPGPARQQGRDEQCLAPLLQHVADAHGLPLHAVLAARNTVRPDFDFARSRQEAPEKYESYVDLEAGIWTKYRIEVAGRTARLYVHGAEQPCLIVNDLKLEPRAGSVALWVGPGTEGYFSNLKITVK